MRLLTAMTAAGPIALSGVAAGPGDRQAPTIFSTVENWLAKRIPGFDGATGKD